METTLPGTGWQRCRTHYAANLMSVTPKASWPGVKAMLQVATSMKRRTPEEVAAFFEGLELVEPGVVVLHDWRPDDPDAPRTASPAMGGVARKP